MATLAARQYGIVTRAQLVELGYTDRMIDRALQAGKLQAWHRDIFAAGHGGLSPHGLCQAALMFRGEGAAISHQSAVWLWGLEKKLEVPVNVTVPWRRHADYAIGIHHCPTLRDEDIASTERLPVTAVSRTLLDYASTAQQYRLEFAIERAERLDLLDPATVDRILDENPEHPGREPLASALAICRRTGLRHAGGEPELLTALADADAPSTDPPRVQRAAESLRR